MEFRKIGSHRALLFLKCIYHVMLHVWSMKRHWTALTGNPFEYWWDSTEEYQLFNQLLVLLVHTVALIYVSFVQNKMAGLCSNHVCVTCQRAQAFVSRHKSRPLVL